MISDDMKFYVNVQGTAIARERKCMPYLVDMFQKRQARDFPEQ